MPTPVHNGGVGGAAKEVAERASQIARLELELATFELKRKAIALGIGAGLLAGAGLFAVLMLGFAFAAAAAAIALVLPWWASLLIVTGILGGLAGMLGAVGAMLLKRGAPPVPQQTLEEAKLTKAALRR